MKINLNKWLGLSTGTLVLLASLNSCVKNRNLTATDFSQIQPVVEMLISTPTSSKPQIFRTVSYDATVTSAVNTIYINYAGAGPAPQDIVVTIAISPATVIAFNADTTHPPTNFVFLSPNTYTLSTTKVTIKKGTYFTPFTVTFNPSLVNLLISNAFAVEIIDAQGVIISKNYHTQMYAVAVKNPFAGDYNCTGWFFHPAVGRAINAVYTLATVSGTRSESPVGDLGGNGFYFDFDLINNVSGNWAAVGSTPGPGGGVGSSGFMTADNPGGTDYSHPSNAGNLPGVGQWLSSIYNNTYNPATKTFWMHYGYIANVPGATQNAYTRQIYEKMVKIP